MVLKKGAGHQGDRHCKGRAARLLRYRDDLACRIDFQPNKGVVMCRGNDAIEFPLSNAAL
ncbi:MAG: hypothetical protein D8M22_09395 [Armatimonadetes bacterium]|nr:hypothetical protein [Armatimonadota bacterium]GIK32529.1 MAG: hypothetical protein BroJett009_15210 [Armatimonadota bacterium]